MPGAHWGKAGTAMLEGSSNRSLPGSDPGFFVFSALQEVSMSHCVVSKLASMPIDSAVQRSTDELAAVAQA